MNLQNEPKNVVSFGVKMLPHKMFSKQCTFLNSAFSSQTRLALPAKSAEIKCSAVVESGLSN